MRPKRKVRTWARVLTVCTLGVLATGLFAAPSVGAAPSATAAGLSNFALAIGTGDDAPSKTKDFDIAFSDAEDPSIQFLNEKSDAAGNLISGDSPVDFDEFNGEGDPCDFPESGVVIDPDDDDWCYLDEGDTEADFDLSFQSNSAVEAFAKLTYILRAGGTVVHTGHIIISVLEGPDIGETGPRQVVDCEVPGAGKPCAIGDEIHLTVRARNVGSEKITGVRVRYEYSSGIKPTLTASGSPIGGCTHSVGSATHITVVICELPNEVLDPGDPFEYDMSGENSSNNEGTINSDAFGAEEICFQVTPMSDTTLVYPLTGPCVLGDVGVLAGAMKQITDIDAQDNWGYVAIKNIATSKFDLAAIGASVGGGVGDEVSVQVGIANRGTGAIDTYRTKQPASRITVKIPSGVQVKTAPPSCSDKTSYWLCSQPGSFLGAGQSYMYTFKLKVGSGAGTGNVSVKEPNVNTGNDNDTSNDDASLRVGSGLPITGLPTMAIAGIGGALLIAGFLLFRVTRRKRPEAILAGLNESDGPA